MLLNHNRHNALNRLLNDPERVRVVPLNGVGSNRDEDGQQVLEDEIGDESGEGGDEEETLVEGLGVSTVGDDFDDGVDVDLAVDGERLIVRPT